MDSQIDICPVCNRRVLKHARQIFCNCCLSNTHKNCTGLWGEDFELATQNIPWYCKSYIEGLFPFNHFDEEMDFLEAIDDIFYQDTVVKLALKTNIFNPFDMNGEENETFDYQGDLDPDTGNVGRDVSVETRDVSIETRDSTETTYDRKPTIML